jgi:hypothetical protein
MARKDGFRISKFRDISSSAQLANTNLIIRPLNRLPHKLKYGKLSKYKGGHIDFEKLGGVMSSGKNIGRPKAILIYESGSEYKKNYLGIEPTIFRDTLRERLQASMSSTAFTQVSNSFFNGAIDKGILDLPIGEYVQTLVDNTTDPASGSYEITPKSQILPLHVHPSAPFPTCSYTITNDFTNDIGQLYEFKDRMSVGSHPVTALDGATSDKIFTTESVRSFNIVYTHPDFTSSLAHGALVGTASLGSASSIFGENEGSTFFSNHNLNSHIGRGTVQYYNPYGSQLAGVFIELELKSQIYGDSDIDVDGVGVGDTPYLPRKKFILFPSESIIESSSFRYHATNYSTTTSSLYSEERILYYVSSAAAPAWAQAFMINTGSYSGSHAFKDADFTIPADEGFYSWGGPTASFGNPIFVGEFSLNTPSNLSGSSINIAPRFKEQTAAYVDGQH